MSGLFSGLRRRAGWFPILFVLLAAAVLAADPPVPAGLDAALWHRAVALTQHSLVVDTHSDATSRMEKPGFDFTVWHEDGHVDLPRMRQGGLDAEFMALYISPRLEGADAVPEALGMLEALMEQVDAHPDKLALARTSQEILRNHQAGKISFCLGMENGTPILKDRLDLLRFFYRQGVRYVGLCHMKSNFLSDSSTDKPLWDGLSPWGETVVREMNRLGMLVDVSHLSDAAVRDILAVSTAPIFASHSGCRALCDVPRDLPDDLIKAIAQKGGVIDVNFYPGFLSAEYNRLNDERRERLKPELDKIRPMFNNDLEGYFHAVAELNAKNPIPRPSVDVLVDHIAHVIEVAGEDHVGLGSDFDGISELPEGMSGCQDLPLITYHLLRRGYTEAQVKKILGGNFLRVFQAVEKAAVTPAKAANQ
jgi:membrane dipeptidase